MRAKGRSVLIKFNFPIALQSTTPLCTALVKLGNELPIESGKQIKKVLSHTHSPIRAPVRC